VNHLTPEERAAYSNGSWLDDERDRCRVCGDLRENHIQTKDGVGHCKVCSCKSFEERKEGS